MIPPTSQKVTSRINSLVPTIKEYAERVLDKSTLTSLLGIVASACTSKSSKLTDAQSSALWCSAQHMLDKQLKLPMLKCNIQRIVANWHFIHDGVVIPEWYGEATESICLFIGVLRLTCKPGERPAYRVKIKLKTGLCAGIITWVTLKEHQIYNFLDKASGTRKYNCACEEIAGMEAVVLVTAHEGVFTIHKWTCKQAQKEHNKRLAEVRGDIRKCSLNRPCNTCACTILDCKLAVWLPKEG